MRKRLIDLVEQKNVWDADIKDRMELLREEDKRLARYEKDQGITSLGLTTFSVDDSSTPPKLIRTLGTGLTIDCYILEMIFGNYVGLADMEDAIRAPGESSPPVQSIDRSDFSHLYTSRHFTHMNTTDYSTFFRYRFHSTQLEEDTLLGIRENVERAFGIFSVYNDPWYMGSIDPYHIICELIADIGLKANPELFFGKELKEGVVIEHETPDQDSSTLTRVQLTDTKTEAIRPKMVNDLKVGQHILYRDPFYYADISDFANARILGVKPG